MKVIFKGLSLASAVALTLTGLCLAAPATAKPAEIGWEVNFDQTDTALLQKVFYYDREGGTNGDAVAVKEISGGVLRYGLKSDPARTSQVGLNLPFGDWNASGEASDWQPVDLARYPLIEVRWRGDSYLGHLYYCIEPAGGERQSAYLCPTADHTEKDADGTEWKISLIRLSANASASVKLQGLNLIVYRSGGDPDHIVDVDYIRVRGFTEQELSLDKKINASMTDFPQGKWRGLDTFFPFGVYDVGFLRGDMEYWDGDYEGAFANYSKHHFNYVSGLYEIIPTRMGAHLSEDGVKKYLTEMGERIEEAKATGMKLSADVRDLASMADLKQGHTGLLPIARRFVEAWPSDDTIVSWMIADEPAPSDVAKYAMMTRAVRESDPLKRPEFLVFFASSFCAPYSPYLNLICPDIYPVVEGDRNPWSIRDTVRQYRRLAPDKPIWSVLQAFDTRPPTPVGSYIRPTDAEMRMMAYLALAEGSKGLVWFTGWGASGREEYMVERTGRPRGGMMDTLRDMGRRLIPIGKLLLQTNPVDEPGIQVKQLDRPETGRVVTVSALKHRKRDLHYLVVINEDLDRTRTAQVSLPTGMIGKKYGVYDLYSLDGKNLLKGNSFTVESLAGGDGRIYVVADATGSGRQIAQVQCDGALEEIRALAPDLTIARRWKLSLGDVDSALKSAEKAAKAGNGPSALAAAEKAKIWLSKAMENHSELNAVRHALSDMQLELSEVQRITEYPSKNPRWWTGRDHPMLVPNPGFLDQSKMYWEAGREYRNLKTRYLKGDRDGLWTEVNKASVDCLRMRESVLSMLRQKLEPVREPTAAK